MIDTGCLCFSMFDESLVRKYKFECKNVKPRSLRLADGKVAANITKISYVDIDIDDRHGRIWGYVMPYLAYPIILGKPWMEHNDVVYSAKLRRL